MLVFRDQRHARALGEAARPCVGAWRDPPRGLSPKSNALLEAPEGTALLFLEEES